MTRGRRFGRGLGGLALAAILAAVPAGCTAPPRPIFGMSVGNDLVPLTDQQLTEALAKIRSRGVTSLRVDLAWEDVERHAPDPEGVSTKDWGAFKRILLAAKPLNLTVLPVLAYAPHWAATPGCPPEPDPEKPEPQPDEQCSPIDPADFAGFAAEAVALFARPSEETEEEELPPITTWEIWNEPNSKTFWSPGADPDAYAELLRLTVPRMREAAGDVALTIVSGGLAATGTGKGNIAPLDFLTQVCAAGGLAGVDAIGFHPYSFPVAPTYPAQWNAWTQMTDPDTGVPARLAACGAGPKPLWATEYGAPTEGPGQQATLTDDKVAFCAPDAVTEEMPEGCPADHVDEPLQAEMARGSVEATVADPSIAALYWFTYLDLTSRRGDVENSFGLRKVDGSYKPAWDALRDAIATAAAP
jgi:polysaccharide biosynthesis protein PslG